ncbi:MAG: recombination protein O N-terminal domain-containing protein [Bacteroidales bacterium]
MIREKIRGIVFSMIPYNDKTSFVHMYTDKFGRVTYAVPNTRSKRTKLPKSLFAPFTILEMEVEHSPGREIQKIAEARVAVVHMNLYADPVKNAVVLFLSEMLSRVIREQEQNIALYQFLTDAIELYELLDEGKANYHLLFLLRISEFLGFRMNRESYQEGYWFDLTEGTFLPQAPEHTWYMTPPEAYLLHSVLNIQFGNLASYQFNREQRTALLDKIVLYFRLHLPDLKEIRSLEVLKMLFA